MSMATAPLPVKKRRASTVAAWLAVAAGLAAPASIVAAVAIAGVLLLIATAFGMPSIESSDLVAALAGWAASGARVGIPFVAVAAVLAVVATALKPRASTALISAAWVAVGLSACVVAAVLFVATPIDV